MISRGDAPNCHDLASRLRQQWRERLGDDHEQVLATTRSLGRALRVMGRYAEARDLHRDTLERYRRMLGEDHPETLYSANTLAADLRGLGEARAARDLAQDTLNRRRRMLGQDHPETLHSAQELAVCLRALGKAQAARDLAAVGDSDGQFSEWPGWRQCHGVGGTYGSGKESKIAFHAAVTADPDLGPDQFRPYSTGPDTADNCSG